MEMLAFQRNKMKLIHSIFLSTFLSATLAASAEIIFQSPSASFVIIRPSHSLTMSGIVIHAQVPSASASPQVARDLQRAHGWSIYEKQNFETNELVVIGGVGLVGDRQSAVRTNVARAQAFRMGFFK
jgi:hypothetical protein